MAPSDIKELDDTVGTQSIMLKAIIDKLTAIDKRLGNHDERFEKMVQAYYALESRIDGAETLVLENMEPTSGSRKMEAEIDKILSTAQATETIRYNVNDKDNLEQMLGDLAAGANWHLLHPHDASWPQVRELRTRIVRAAMKQGIYAGTVEACTNSVASAIWKNSAFKTYREWVFRKTGDPYSSPAQAGLDPWSYVEGLKILAGEATDGAYLSYFNEIHQKPIMVARKPQAR